MTAGAPFAAIIAGGRSIRYGAPKALARVAGARLIDRVLGAARAVLPDVVVIGNDKTLAEAVDCPWRPDLIPELGALGGIHAALRWAEEDGRPGILALACDMPFLSVALLRALLEAAIPRGGAGAAKPPDAVVPESGGRRGIEPLCAYYGVSCIPAIEAAIARGDHRMVGFHPQVALVRLPLAVVRGYGRPEILFLNVNTPADRAVAEQSARENDSHA